MELHSFKRSDISLKQMETTLSSFLQLYSTHYTHYHQTELNSERIRAVKLEESIN